jgi:hypothetical protein
MFQELPAAVKKLLPGGGSPNAMQEFRSDAFTDEVHIFLHLLDLKSLPEPGRGSRDFIKVRHVGQDIAARGLPPTPSALVFSDLFKDPRIAYAPATDH